MKQITLYQRNGWNLLISGALGGFCSWKITCFFIQKRGCFEVPAVLVNFSISEASKFVIFSSLLEDVWMPREVKIVNCDVSITSKHHQGQKYPKLGFLQKIHLK